MKKSDYVASNRVMWNKTAEVHAGAYVEQLLERIKDPGYSTFDEVEKRLFSQIDLAGKAVAQLCCNNGRELISVKRAGAVHCTGFDLSDRFIEQARQLAAAAGADVEFVRGNVYDIEPGYDSHFDLVYITIGAFGWLPDLDGFFQVIRRLLKSDGQLFVYEMHPLLDMFEPEKGPVPEYSYFRSEPYYSAGEADYFDPGQTIQADSYWFHHKLSDIINGCLRHGLSLTHFEEYEHDISEVFRHFEKLEHKLPLSYSLIAASGSPGKTGCR